MLSVREKELFTVRNEKRVVLIYDDSSDLFIGHGVLISRDGYILTVSHLFDSSDSVVCYVGETKQKYRAEIVVLERKSDLAILKIEGESLNFKWASIANRIRIGLDTHMITSGDGRSFCYTPGLVCYEDRLCSDITDTEHIKFISSKTQFVQVHGLHGIPGCSGVPVFNSRGQIVGVYSSGYKRMDLLVHFELLNKICGPFIQKPKKQRRRRVQMMMTSPFLKFMSLSKKKRRQQGS